MSGMMTEQEALELRDLSRTAYLRELRNRGIVEQLPADPLMQEVESLLQEWSVGGGDLTDLVLSALRRGRVDALIRASKQVERGE
jgi:hypothetical protein